MTKYLGQRLLAVIPTAVGVVTLVFLIIHLVPGDPVLAMLGDDAPIEARDALRARLGLDQPLHIQYGRFMLGLVQGDLGRSLHSNREVVQELRRVLPHTILLATAAMLVGVLLGPLLGIISSLKRNSSLDFLVSVFAIIGYASPVFLVGLVLIWLLSLRVGWFPVTGAGDFSEPRTLLPALVLPAVTLGMNRIALMARMTRSSMLEVYGQDYIRTARAKGLNRRVVVYRHALRNAMIPVVTVAGLEFGNMLGGTAITEVIFTRPGLGRTIVGAIFGRDYPLVQGSLLVFALMFMVLNLLVDLTYAAIDPRIRYG